MRQSHRYVTPTGRVEQGGRLSGKGEETMARRIRTLLLAAASLAALILASAANWPRA